MVVSKQTSSSDSVCLLPSIPGAVLQVYVPRCFQVSIVVWHMHDVCVVHIRQNSVHSQSSEVAWSQMVKAYTVLQLGLRTGNNISNCKSGQNFYQRVGRLSM